MAHCDTVNINVMEEKTSSNSQEVREEDQNGRTACESEFSEGDGFNSMEQEVGEEDQNGNTGTLEMDLSEGMTFTSVEQEVEEEDQDGYLLPSSNQSNHPSHVKDCPLVMNDVTSYFY
ncbi:uncharacterized protein LOC117118676 [Anneissia japonica]|uniref:uncharacterized protein LOC117118676 n=1 Tax=Anneissia japonica TaxID=1529436 RepID=UPI001425B6E8|nr:uncharacterized protein LOC117118676 [Anneissia japonica]